MLPPSSSESRFARYQCLTPTVWAGEAENPMEGASLPDKTVTEGEGAPSSEETWMSETRGWKGAEKEGRF